jgi:hypothetical protein
MYERTYENDFDIFCLVFLVMKEQLKIYKTIFQIIKRFEFRRSKLNVQKQFKECLSYVIRIYWKH